MNVPIFYPDVTKAQKKAVYETLNTRWIGQGPVVDLLEERLEKLFGRPCVAVNSCTSALHLALILAGVTDGDEVLSPVLTCTATNTSILYQRAKPIFCDIAPGSLLISP